MSIIQGPSTRCAGPQDGAADIVAARSLACRVLVVDDNEDAAASLALLLRLTGHEIRTATDGATALRAAQEFRPDAVILDLGLPGLDGCAVARQMRGDPGLAGVFLVALTGFTDEGLRLRSLEAGFDCHFLKPADPEELLRLLAELARAR
jgi:CheY-like chemotaxis protein